MARIRVQVGSKAIGGGEPILVQSMTNTDTANINETVAQIKELHDAGSEIVRLTVNNETAARAVPAIKNILIKQGLDVPLAGCFHYNGHQLLSTNHDLCEALDKFRINPGNVGFGQKRDKHFEQVIELAIKYNKPVRIGVNWGSLDQSIQKKLIDKNNEDRNPRPINEILQDALIESCISSAKFAEDIGLASDKIILSCKVSKVRELVTIYRSLAKLTNYPLHLGLTEAGMGLKGTIYSSVALSILLAEGIGDTIRVSLTPKPNESRTQEVKICQEILQALELRSFEPKITSCPGCGRTTSTYFQELASDIESYISLMMPKWKICYPGVEKLKIAVMGCIVNGPGESKHADIGISLPGTGESPIAPVFIDGKKEFTLRGENICEEFKSILSSYIERKFSKK